MFRYINKKIRCMSLKRKGIAQDRTSNNDSKNPVLPNLQSNLEVIKSIFCSSDVIIHKFSFGYDRKIMGALVYIDSIE